MKNLELIEALKKVNEEVKKLEAEGYTVEIALPSGKYKSVEQKTEIKVYKPTSF